jgi:hypothetical protein
VASTAEISRSRTSRASRVALHCQMSSARTGVLSLR